MLFYTCSSFANCKNTQTRQKETRLGYTLALYNYIIWQYQFIFLIIVSRQYCSVNKINYKSEFSN